MDLIVDASDPQARDLHRVLSASLAETRVPAPRLIDINQPLASLLDEVRPSRHVLVAVRKGHDLKKLHHLLDELAIINREVNGMIYLGDQVAAPASAPTAPAQSAEVIVPTDEAQDQSSEAVRAEQDEKAEDEKVKEEKADSKKADSKKADSKKAEAKASSKKGKK